MKVLNTHLRFPGRVFALLVLTAFAIAVSAASRPIAAQQPAGQPQATQSSATPSESANPAETEEEQQNKAFLLEGPIVKWTARTLNLSIEQAAGIYEVINFLIIALAIGVPLFRILPKVIRGRSQKLTADIEAARKVTEDANSRLKAVEAKLATLDQEIQKFRAEVESEAAQDEARIKASLEEESHRIVAAAEQEIATAAAQARRGLRTFAADLAIDQAARQLVLTAETDRALIAEFVGDAARHGGNN